MVFRLLVVPTGCKVRLIGTGLAREALSEKNRVPNIIIERPCFCVCHTNSLFSNLHSKTMSIKALNVRRPLCLFYSYEHACFTDLSSSRKNIQPFRRHRAIDIDVCCAFLYGGDYRGEVSLRSCNK